MIKKVYQFKTFSDQEKLFYEFKRDTFSNLPGPQPFTLRKTTQRGELEREVKDVDESTVGLILEQLLINHQHVDIEYFSYTREFQERNK
jgi:hypothetical protein